MDHVGALRRSALVTASVLVIGGAIAPVAHAALANGAASETDTRPDLRSVALATGPSAGSQRVRFCFDAMLLSTHLDPKGFSIGGYDSAQLTVSTNAVFDADDSCCVIAVFPSDADVPQATIGTVSDDAVRLLASGKSALGDSAPFADSAQETDPGRTDAPDLVSARSDASFNEIVFRFDRRLGNAGSGARYAYYDAAGNRVSGVDAALDLDNRHLVRVMFPSAGGEGSVRDAIRAVVLPATVTAAGAPGKVGPGLAVAVDGRDGQTARPDLVSASKSGPNSVDFVFDQPVALGDAAQFIVYRVEASGHTGQNAAVLTSRPNVVRVWFGVPAQRFSEQFVVATVADDGAAGVRGTNGWMANTMGSAPIGAIPNAQGFTSAPDATGVTFDPDDGTATITFDQPVDDTAAFSATEFRLVDRAGNDLAGASSAVALVTGSQVKLSYGSGRVTHGVAVQLLPGAVRGFGSDLSVLQAIGRSVAPATTTTSDGSTSAAPQTGSSPAAAPDGPAATIDVGGGGSATGGAQQGPATGTQRTAGLRVVWARLRAVGGGRYALALRVAGTPRRARVRIAVIDRRGRIVGVVVRAVRTNRTVRIKRLRAVAGGRLRISVAR